MKPVTTHYIMTLLESDYEGHQRVGATHLLIRIEEWVSYAHKRKFDGLKISQTDDGWLGMVMASRGRTPEVAFIAAATYEDLLVNLAKHMVWGRGVWKTDKYRSMRSDK